MVNTAELFSRMRNFPEKLVVLMKDGFEMKNSHSIKVYRKEVTAINKMTSRGENLARLIIFLMDFIRALWCGEGQ